MTGKASQKNYRLIPLFYIVTKIPNKTLQIEYSNIIKGLCNMTRWSLS